MKGLTNLLTLTLKPGQHVELAVDGNPLGKIINKDRRTRLVFDLPTHIEVIRNNANKKTPRD